jgi:uncharacterized protein (TIGR00661 family)
MKILFGVQATGNGHISRSREVIRHLKAAGHSVQVILSGRDSSLLWDMEVFKPYISYSGLTFSVRRGRIQYLKSLSQLHLFRFFSDIRNFNARGYDLVITDFEPITARIAISSGLPSIGIGHQYAFSYKIPIDGFNPLSWLIMRTFAPARFAIGLHWHHFKQPILPPIVPETVPVGNGIDRKKVLVYLPFEELTDVRSLMGPFNNYQFFIYHQHSRPGDEGHLKMRGYSREGFLRDLSECCAVIANAGFELSSEAISLGKKILVKPLAGQMEQLSNARAIAELKLGRVMKKLERNAVRDFLADPPAEPVGYPNVARMIADWIGAGNWNDISELSRLAWRQTASPSFRL